MAKETKQEYIPGVCNIGNAEANNRRRTAYGASAVALIVWATLLYIQAPSATLLIVGLPGFVAGTAFIQARQRFCAGFGAEGLYNFTDTVGAYSKSEKADDRAKDKRKAVQITKQAAVIGTVTGALAVVSAVVL